MARKKEFDINSEFYLDGLFIKWQEKMDLKVIEDLKLLQKYKGELAKSFNEVREHRNTLISCMHDIMQTQDELRSMFTDLIKVITGQYPAGRITAIEVKVNE